MNSSISAHADVPFWAGSIVLVDDVLFGMFGAFEPPQEPVDLTPGIRSAGAVAGLTARSASLDTRSRS
jgi:hypothetical protein